MWRATVLVDLQLPRTVFLGVNAAEQGRVRGSVAVGAHLVGEDTGVVPQIILPGLDDLERRPGRAAHRLDDLLPVGDPQAVG